jgi:hypothetical protein
MLTLIFNLANGSSLLLRNVTFSPNTQETAVHEYDLTLGTLANTPSLLAGLL